MKKIWHLIKDENGLEVVEYAILLGLVVAGSIGLIVALALWVQEQFQRTVGGV
jgi:Flp pilus assembly pilin Flp